MQRRRQRQQQRQRQRQRQRKAISVRKLQSHYVPAPIHPPLLNSPPPQVRTDTTYPAGFMDVIDLDKTDEHFRLVYDTKGRFVVHRISREEATYKLCKVGAREWGGAGLGAEAGRPGGDTHGLRARGPPASRARWGRGPRQHAPRCARAWAQSGCAEHSRRGSSGWRTPTSTGAAAGKGAA
jgi:hypothetical protein